MAAADQNLRSLRQIRGGALTLTLDLVATEVVGGGDFFRKILSNNPIYILNLMAFIPGWEKVYMHFCEGGRLS
jgi:hypothetical protein